MSADTQLPPVLARLAGAVLVRRGKGGRLLLVGPANMSITPLA